ncbi:MULTISPECIES: hypothetical protein [unclassified Variovorax]|uniref:hypothetical protein n=1 Tax=unclassified Variovorax TaxID=663243 RepID=UPI001317A488|nr:MULTISPECIES: hypothetical protein [unclassified Variovorax]VTU24036.1 hypothetical protein SRS16CHR_03372 [Variovorax sp. SRS16]VTU32248.1 hypothetical protein E5CHR_03379 [Variovorax sp. PBL-E5]
MKKILFALAACALVSGTALAQPAPSSQRSTVVVDRADVVPVRWEHRRHRRWVPPHWQHGHRVPGHYVWR